MANITIKVNVHVAWWLRWYMAGVYMMALTTGLQPDLAKVERVVMRAIRVSVK